MTATVKNRGGSNYWGTESEIEYLQGLGYWLQTNTSRKELLRRYIQASRFRNCWKSIERAEVIRVAMKMLKQEEGQ